MSVGTKTPVLRFASAWISTFELCASWTIRITLAQEGLLADFAGFHLEKSQRASGASGNLIPRAFSIGIGSPVAKSSSTLLSPETTTPSVRALSRGWTIMMSPFFSRLRGTVISSPLHFTVAFFASRVTSPSAFESRQGTE